MKLILVLIVFSYTEMSLALDMSSLQKICKKRKFNFKENEIVQEYLKQRKIEKIEFKRVAIIIAKCGNDLSVLTYLNRAFVNYKYAKKTFHYFDIHRKTLLLKILDTMESEKRNKLKEYIKNDYQKSN